MARDMKTLFDIFEKTHGRCHLCRGDLKFENYGHRGPDAWHVEHSNPRALGGTDYLRNLWPAHATCNLEKGTRSTRSVRAAYGFRRAPLSRAKKNEVRAKNAMLGGGSGALIGGLVGGPPGAALGAALGSLFGGSLDPEDEER